MAPSAGVRARETHILRGIGFVLLTTLLFATMNAEVKYLSRRLPVVEIIWVRMLGHLVSVVAIFAPWRGGWRLFVTSAPGIQLGRSVLLIAGTSCFFTAIGQVPLADATAVTFVSPLIVAALARPLLGERVSLRHAVTIAVGFIGALVVIRPTGGGTNLYIVLVLGTALFDGLYHMFTRQVAAYDAPETSVAYAPVVGTLVLSAVVPFSWRAPEGPMDWTLFLSLGVLGGLGHYCVARAFVWGPASILTPFFYAQIVGAAVLGYVFFGDVPGVWTWLGSALIIGSGLSIAWRATRIPQRPRPSASTIASTP